MNETATRPLRFGRALTSPARLTAVRRTGLVDAPGDAIFDRFAEAARQMTGVPMAAIEVLDGERLFFTSAVGFPERWATTRALPVCQTICAHVVADEAPLIVRDARLRPPLRDTVPVRDLGVVAYLGLPLTTAAGYVIGVMCLLDTAPRTWSAANIDDVAGLVPFVEREIDLRARLTAFADGHGAY